MNRGASVAYDTRRIRERTANEAIDDPHIRCLPDNFLRAYGLDEICLENEKFEEFVERLGSSSAAASL